CTSPSSSRGSGRKAPSGRARAAPSGGVHAGRERLGSSLLSPASVQVGRRRMPLFEFDEGRLVPAQFGRPVLETVEPEVLQAVREQVLEVVAEPLFPVSWHDDDARPRLTAMDPSGQVVMVEVTQRLDAASLVAALSRAGRMAERGWLELAETYPRGVAAFRRDWNSFREAMPPHPVPGPRLVV